MPVTGAEGGGSEWIPHHSFGEIVFLHYLMSAWSKLTMAVLTVSPECRSRAGRCRRSVSDLSELLGLADGSPDDSIRPGLSSCRPLNASSSGNSWLIHLVRRLLHPSQTASVGAAKVHRVLRRLHSQQLWVPLRIFRLLDKGGVSPTAGEFKRGSTPDISISRRCSPSVGPA